MFIIYEVFNKIDLFDKKLYYTSFYVPFEIYYLRTHVPKRRYIMIKILHISDLHLNTPFKAYSPLQQKRLSEWVYYTFECALETALQEDVDALIIAGDFVDAEPAGFVLEHRIANSLMPLLTRGIHVIYATGNHDYKGLPQMVESLNGHPCFHIFSQSVASVIRLVSKNGETFTVVGCGHDKPDLRQNVIQTFPVRSDECITIGVAHAHVAQVKGAVEKEKYMPTRREDIEKLNYHYFALGHIHERQLLGPSIAYSGAHQGFNKADLGERGGYLCTISQKNVMLKEVTFSKDLFMQLSLTIPESVENMNALRQWIVQEISKAINLEHSEVFLRIQLNGQSSLYNELSNVASSEYLSQLLQEELEIIGCDVMTHKVLPKISDAFLKNPQTIYGYIYNLIDQLGENETLMTLIPDVVDIEKLDSDVLKQEWIKRMMKVDYDN